MTAVQRRLRDLEQAAATSSAGAAASSLPVALQPMDTDDDSLTAAQLHSISHESASQHALTDLQTNALGEFSPPPARPHSPRSVAAGVRGARAEIETAVRQSAVRQKAGRRTKQQAAADTAVGAPSAKFGSTRYRAVQFHTSQSRVSRMDRRKPRTLTTPERRGGHNALVGSRVKAAMQIWLDDLVERDVHVSSEAINQVCTLLRTVMPRVLHDPASSSSSGNDDDADSDDNGSKPGSSAGAASAASSAAETTDAESEADAASPPRLGRQLRRKLQRKPQPRPPDLAEARKRKVRAAAGDVKPLSAAALSRLCRDLGWSSQKAQPRKPARLRATRSAELQHFRENARLWPAGMLFATDETKVFHTLGPTTTWARRGARSAHVKGERRGPSTTLVLCASGYLRRKLPGCCCTYMLSAFSIPLLTDPCCVFLRSGDPPKLLTPFFIHSHLRLPKDDSRSDRKCPLKQGLPCVCDHKNVAGVHANQWEFIVDSWCDELPKCSAVILDLLRAHLSSQTARRMFDAEVQQLFTYAGEQHGCFTCWRSLCSPLAARSVHRLTDVCWCCWVLILVQLPPTISRPLTPAGSLS